MALSTTRYHLDDTSERRRVVLERGALKRSGEEAPDDRVRRRSTGPPLRSNSPPVPIWARLANTSGTTGGRFSTGAGSTDRRNCYASRPTPVRPSASPVARSSATPGSACRAFSPSTSRLEYRTQSGALNESYSDIFGIVIANLSKPLRKWVWKVGVGFDRPGTALRSLSNPALHRQPKKMSEYRPVPPPYTYERNDYGWVHDNSGIHNFAAYKIMNASANGKYLFTPAQLAAIFYIALTVHLPRTSQFADSRRAVVQATRSLFRKDSAAALAQKMKAVEKGFLAAGIVWPVGLGAPLRDRNPR
ncbi:thermolysin metallopeptidase-like protein [Paraburkholderia sp. RAU2J]|uniref:M4 family metallopeptidase n=1 Tax=Paraburkholderia sp. RAU2J TaxID=1938810 RepID=UPI000F1F8346|nr:M4 family metallopeptidase [Paraburkholderia sp. RAU2J]RKT13779.1 thermolysin metallopeptidase-like protein [Paraburkholderia sp. RAU2J]